jgi:octaprenyl-diphosphate synthase
MSRIVEEIKVPIANELEIFERKFKESMKSNVPLLNRITHYIVKRKGKRIRPMFLFLSARLIGDITERTYRGASLIELLHTATLVHDDVVDDAYERRGFFSINALWKNKIAVLVGDFLLSRGLLLSVEHEDFDLLKIVTEAVRLMSEGELLQIEKARKLDIAEDVYYEIIRQKTATLISSACEVGVVSSGGDTSQAELARMFGEKTGMAFQIKDDLFDYGDATIGKPTRIDIQEKKMTLPLIYALNMADKKKRKWMINIVKNHNKNKKKVEELVKTVIEAGGIEYAIEKMNHFRDEALEYLSRFPDNKARQSLEKLVNYTIERKY